MNGSDRLESALARLIEQLGESQVPVDFAVLYGSAARGDWDPARSDVNLLLVMSDPSPASLKRLSAALTSWHDAGFTPPLLLGRSEWMRATDVFPIEITDMRLCHRTLLGADPLEGLKVPAGDLRRALESELRGKLMRLRQAFVRFHAAPQVLGGFARSSCSELLALLRTTAVLLDRDPGPSADAGIAALADELGDAAAAVREVAVGRSNPDWSCPDQVFARYLDAVQRAADLVDRTPTGA
ncbi:MAG TPA: nucleotidyltransferase domain-containing protein [Gemmatimonadales bacterium]|nr:nucleotidyltransferase domain-containing protein [Gemmatimonadales bacterium]